MKKKSVFFTLLICVLSVFGAFGFFDVNFASATSTSASVWDGEKQTTQPSDLDFYIDGAKYYIRSAKGLAYFANTINTKSGYQTYSGCTIYLETDIDLYNKSWIETKFWTPIGNETQYFQGTFDAQNHTIFNLNVSTADGNYAGLFGFTTGTIKNLKIKNANISSSVKYVGVIAGGVGLSTSSSQRRIEKCAVGGSITINSTNTNVGGLVGCVNKSTIYRSFSEVVINGGTASENSIGGIVGFANASTIDQCYNAGNITTTSQSKGYAGGIVGETTTGNVTINNSYNTANVAGFANAGGIVGRNEGSLTLKFVYNTGEISATNCGGIIGFNNSQASILNAMNLNENVQNLYNENSSASTDETNVYNYVNIQTLAKTREFYTSNYFSTDWDFSTVWNISTSKNNSLPYLINVNYSADNDVDYSFETTLKGSGIAGDPYQIYTAGDLGWLSFNYSNFSGKYFALQNDIDLSGKTWQPIGDSTIPFSGVFDGNGYTISGMTCSLQEQFGWHGLFGVTGDAVIKNLTVSDVKIINSGNANTIKDYEGYMGSFVGEIKGNTYIINCTDRSGISDLWTVRHVDGGTLYAIYGKRNANLDGLVDETTLKLGTNTVTKGYDIEIFGDKGNFYKPDGSIYMGTYHILADKSLTKVIDVTAIDSTFGQGAQSDDFGMLPTTSEYFGKQDVLIKRGYKLDGYKYNYSGNTVEGSLSPNNIVLGLTAVWKERTITLTVDYNSYERDNFGATETVTKELVVEYDSFVGDYPKIYESPVTRKGFEIEGIYKEYKDKEFSNLIVENAFINDSYSKTLFAKWIGKDTDDAKSQIRIVFNKTEDIFADNFDISDAVKSVKLNNSSGQNSISGTLSGNGVSIDYNTLYSDSVDNWLNLKLELNDGYEFAGDVFYDGLHSSIDPKFGVLTLTGYTSVDSDTKMPYVNGIQGFNNVKFYNLSGDYTINISLKRSSYSNTITIGNGVVFGVAPNLVETNQEGKIQPQALMNETFIYNFYSGANENLSSAFGFSKDNVFVGYDFENNKILTSNTIYDANTLDTKYTNGSQIRLTYGVDTARYFVYEMTTETIDGKETRIVTLYETNASWESFEKIVTLSTSDDINYKAEWLSKSSYTYIFSTEDDNLVFNNITPLNYMSDDNKMYGNNNKETKFLMSFTDINALLNEQNQVQNIQAVTAYTKAVFNYNFVEKVGDELRPIENAPIFTTQETAKDISENGTLAFSFEASRYYKFASDEEISLYNKYNVSNYNLKFVVSNVSDDSDKSWEKTFNDTNYKSNEYFQNILTDASTANPSMNFIKGTRDESTKEFAPDTFTFELPFAQNGLKAGYYEVYIVCEPVLYQLGIDTQFVDYSKTINGERPTTFEDETGHGIITTASNLSNAQSNMEDILYSDEISISTTLGENEAYEFYGWYFEGENYCGYIDIKDINYSFIYNDRYLSNLENNNGTRYGLNITAVYTKKEAKVEISDRVVLYDENGSGVEQEYNATNLQLAFSLNKQNVYNYKIEDEKDTSLHGLQISKTGNHADGYYILGWELRSGNEVVERYLPEADEVLDVFDLYELVKNQIENGQTDSSHTFTLVPIIKQKSVEIYFHSGAIGDYKQGKDGHVFDVNKTETTDSVYSYSTLFKNSTIYLGEELNGVVMDNQFASRTGYHMPSNNYWNWVDKNNSENKGTLNGSSVTLSARFFAYGQMKAELHFYRVWEANEYYVKFNGNGATSGSMSRQTLTYDTASLLNSNKFARAGYEFAGWATESEGEKVYDNQESVENLSDGNGAEVELFAVWTPKQYKIRIFTNGAESFNGENIVFDEQLTNAYDETITFANTFNEINIDSFNAERSGYKYSGIYTKNKTKITNSTIFDNNLYGFNFNDDYVLSLYIGWEFDTSKLSLGGVNSNLGTLVYNAYDQTIELSQAFKNAITNGYVVDKDEYEHLVISMPENWHTSVLLTLTSTQIGLVENARNTFFKVKDAGSYYVNLEISLKDETEYLSLGTVNTKTLSFYVTVNKAEIVGKTNSDALIVSAKKLLGIYCTEAEKSAINSCQTFAGIGNILGLSGKTDAEIAEFIFTKYYKMLTNVGVIYTTYKNWTFEDFETFKEENPDSVSGLLANFSLVDFYEYGAQDYTLSGYDKTIYLDSEDVSSVELSIEERKIFAYGNFAPKNSYDLRLYLSGDAIDNYNVLQDDEGNYYVVAGKVLLLPEILVLENQENNKYTYFNGNLINVVVDWQGDRESFEYDYKTYYLLKDKIYLSANVYTSNIGRYDLDTNYNFKDGSNYLYFDDVSIVEKISDTEIVNVTEHFGLTMKENDIFTILSTKGMASFDISARYLTIEDGITYFNILPTSLFEGLLKITSVTYDKDGALKTTQNMNGLSVGNFEDDGVPLFQILANNDNSVSILVNQSVRKIVVNTATNFVNDYVGLYKWTTSYIGYVDGTMETNGNYEIDVSSLTLTDEGVSEFFYYAVYTDLVQVNYKLNLPDGYANSSTTSSLKLGNSTYDHLNIPSEKGLILTNLYLTKLDGTKVNLLEQPSSLFTGENGVFVGLSTSARHTKIMLEATWKAEEIICEQLITSKTLPVSTFNRLYASEVAYIENKNETLYTYSYGWYKDGELVSTNEQLKLTNNGSYDESGNYSLKITATLKKLFESSVDNVQDATTSTELSFDMLFMRNKVQGIFLPEQTSCTYDSYEHIKDWEVVFEIAQYDEYIEGYNIANEQGYRYIETGSIKFEAKIGSSNVSTMKNAGIYTINILIDENIYEVGESLSTTFQFTVLPYEFDLLEKDIKMSKSFNVQEGDLEYKTTLVNNEEITLIFTRDFGEDVGEYNLYMSDILGDVKGNYLFKAGDSVVFENGSLTTEGQTESIGIFEIVSSGRLLVKYDTSSTLPAQISADYNAQGYTISLEDNFVLKIYKAGAVFKTLTLKLYDEYSKKDVSSQMREILNNHISALTAKFYDSTSKDCIVESGNYTYYFELGEEFSKYYSSVEFESGFGFNIKQIEINVGNLVFDKTYDGKTYLYLTTSGNKIDDINTFTGLYISGQYATAHAGENVKVELSLLNKDSEENLSNYTLSTNTTYATISKLQATLTISMTKDEFEYGVLSQSNFQDYVSSTFDVKDTNNNNVSSLLMEGYYNLSYSLPTSTSLSASGYIHKGYNYRLNVVGNFNDFDMTIVAPQFTVSAKNIEKSVVEGFVTISVLDKVQEKYTEEYVVNATGDVLTLEYYAVGLTSGQTASVGTYNLALVTSEFENGSIIVTIPENNNGFEVVYATETVYVKLNDISILTQVYNGSNYVLSVENKTLKITNGENSVSSTMTFFTKNDSDETELPDIEFNTLEISGTYKNAGNYRLVLNASSNEYSNVIFDQEYLFVITPISVDIEKLTLEKTYDRSDNITISSFDEKVEGDDVSIYAKFANANVGENKAVTLYLQGAQKGNYTLSATTSTGEITKASAQVTLTKTEYTYGQIDDRNLLLYSVKSNDKNLLSSDYNLTLQIQSPTYSTMKYLCVGNYSVTIGSVTSGNFDITMETSEITISALEINPIFTISGEVYFECSAPEAQTNTFEYSYLSSLRESVTLTVTRESGSSIGNYRALSATSQNDNYVVGTVTDSSESGMFRLTKAKETLYLLLSDEETLSADGDDGLCAEMTYDGNVYDRVGIVSRGVGVYSLSIYNSKNSSVKKEFELNYYTYDSDSKIYTKVNEVVDGLQTVLKFSDSEIKNVGQYAIYSSDTVSSNFDVRMGKNEKIYSYYLNIEKRQLYFKNNVLEKVFDNKDATFVYDDASVMLDNIVLGESLSLSVKFMNGSEIAKYAGTKYSVEANIFGDTIENYNFNLTTQDGTAIEAKITHADITFVINSQTFAYGSEVDLEYEYITEVDLTGYDMSRMNIRLLPNATDANYSTSGALKVGEYSMVFVFNASDFNMAGYVTDNSNQEELKARLIITPIALTLTEKSTSLSEIFTKAYDSTNSVKIKDENDVLLFNIQGIRESESGIDNVTISEANYLVETIGKSIQIDFTLSGDDASNYTLSSYPYGVINPVVITLNFDYCADGSDVKSNVDRNGLTTISQLAFPFMSMSNLTSNSNDVATNNPKNFPTSLTGRTGYSFVYWTLEFENIENNSEEFAYLDYLSSSLGLTTTYQGEVYAIRVGNDENTIKLLNSLVNDDRDFFGLYYRTHEDIKVTFKANWDINKYKVTILIADENGNNAQFGQVEVVDANGSTIINDKFTAEFEYGTTLTLRATANEHSYFVGFYSTDGIYDGTQDGIELSQDGEVRILKVTNVRQAYNFVVRFKVQKINVQFDLSDFQDSSVNDERFEKQSDNKYLWTTNYIDVQSLTLADLPTITRTGYNVVSLSVGSTTIDSSNFGTTNIADLIGSSTDETVTLSFTPTFESIGVVVTLDYGYDRLTDEIVVGFGQTYGSATGWQERPIREGYDFVKWIDENDNTIVGTDTVSVATPHTLTAVWNIQSYALTLDASHAKIEQSSVEFVNNGNIYHLDSVQYASVITFKVSADEGYEISTDWSSMFEVVINEDKTANVTLTMPAQDLSYTLPIVAVQNTVTISGDHIGKLFDITNNENKIEIIGNSFEIATGKTIKLQVEAEVGYRMMDSVSCDDSNVTIEKVLSNEILILEISGITKDTTISLSTESSINYITLNFDNNEAVQSVEVNNLTYNDIANLPTFKSMSNETLSIYIEFKHGYILKDVASEQFDVTSKEESGRIQVDVTNITSDGTVNVSTQFDKFKITMEVISYNGNRETVEVADNCAFANGLTEIEIEYQSKISLTYTLAEKYSFAGWSKDGQNIFNNENGYQYTVTDDETIYAIFSTMCYNITLATYDFYTLYDEYGDESKIQQVYTEISGATYLDGNTGESISSMELYFGANKSFKYIVPVGYKYYGYGYIKNGSIVYLDKEERLEEQIIINISSLSLDDTSTDIKLYVVVKSYKTEISFETKIDIDGDYESDIDVGYIELVDSEANAVNAYGYVEGTRVHYTGEHDNKEFTVVAYTGDKVYFKIKTMREGYKFFKLVSNNENLSCLQVGSSNEYILYEISNIFGKVEGTIIQVLYKPHLNTINLSFECLENIVDGGAFTIKPSQSNKVWWSGRDYSAISVSAYTDSSFEVFAYIKAGYYFENSPLNIIDENGIILDGSIAFEKLSVTDTGYTGKLTFKVSNYLGINEIKVCITALTYTVVLKEGANNLAQIKNVAFGSALNLYEYNSENITIFDERITFVNSKLKVDIQKANYNFEGFFTCENGAGVRYINSEGNAINNWNETGYVYNTLSGKFELTDNARINEQTGEMEISIYIYWSYLKTRITFDFVPNISTKYTAKDMVSGVDYSNSWFYETAPNYIEVAFNNNIQITAPKLEGYKFYKFVISQKDASGLWLEDVEAFADTIPWSTNELDRIVECNIKIVYFAKVEVIIIGGEGSYKITQESSDTQAKILVQESYVDTTKYFQIEAVEGEGYEFIRWSSGAYGQKVLNRKTSSQMVLIMNLQGRAVTLDFTGYDYTHGQILNARTTSLDNTINTYRIGSYVGDTFLPLVDQLYVKVGDKVTFIMSVEKGFAVSWQGRNDISFVDYLDGLYYFEMEIVPTFAGKTLQINPIFNNTIISIYVVRDFADYNDKALDKNNVELAGSVYCNGVSGNLFEVERGEEIRITLTLNPRYDIDDIIIKNYGNTFTDFAFEDGIIILSQNYLDQNNIIGTIQILITYKRTLWSADFGDFEGDGDKSNPYLIKTVEDLTLMMEYVNNGQTNSNGVSYQNCAYMLMADLDLSEKFWTPIGTQENYFNGYFNFNDHKITGINNDIFYEETRYGGLFGVLGSNAQIVTSEPNYWFVYVIVGIAVSLGVLIVALIWRARRKKKRREELSKN
ncbi:MAG: InlB B-repeat-containing protein [Candidatus Caccovivens sp.]